jgi:hypothetical protein
MISCVTPTGDRPIPLALCRRWLERQTVQPDEWLVVDDGKESSEAVLNGTSLRLRYLRRPRQLREPVHTLSANLTLALQEVRPGNAIVVIEDDDWYAANYLESVRRYLTDDALVGMRPTVYYRVNQSSYCAMATPARSSLFCTAFGHKVRPTVTAVCRTDQMFVDLAAWQTYRGPTVLWSQGADRLAAIGIKGLPGRPGQSSGWRMDIQDGYADDPDNRWLRVQIGDDITAYAPYFKRHAAKNQIVL